MAPNIIVSFKFLVTSFEFEKKDCTQLTIKILQSPFKMQAKQK